MGNKYQSGGSFSPRQKKQKQKKFAITLIFLLIIAVLALFAILIFNEVAASCKGCGGGCTGCTGCSGGGNNNPADTSAGQPDDTTSPPATADFDLTDKYFNTGDVKKGELILINSTYKYQFPASEILTVNIYEKKHRFDKNGRQVAGIQCDNVSELVAAGMMDKLNSLVDDFYAAATVCDLTVPKNGGYRTKAEQEAIYSAALNKYGNDIALHAAEAGATEHNTGYAVDFTVFVTTATALDTAENIGTYGWIYNNCYKYGFILRYPEDKATVTGVGYEKDHFRYIGYPHAYYIKTSGLCLEEYLTTLKTTYNSPENPLLINGDNGKNYAVYYAAVGGDSTNVKVPLNLPYTVSGDNMTGIIITVTLN